MTDAIHTHAATRFAYRRGRGARRRVFHLVMYDRWGNMQTACGARADTTINVPLGQRICKRCQKEWNRDGRD